MTRARELRDMTVEALREKAQTLRRELFALRMQKAGGRMESPARFQQVRREIARLLTVVREKR